MLRMIPLNRLGIRFVRHDHYSRRAHSARTQLAVELLESRLVLDRTVLDMVHSHIEVNYANGAWTMDVLDETDNVVYAPSDVLLYVNASARQTQPAGWNFIGAGDGNLDWQLPEEEDPTLLTVALSTEDTAPGTFNIYRPNDPRITRAGEWMKFTLRDLQGPGDISAWQDDQGPPSSWWISSYDGGRTLDPVVYIEPGGHMHLNWGFTAAGIYQATFEASGFLNGHGLPSRSDDVTFTFGVEDTGTTPPPGARATPPFDQALRNVGISPTGSLGASLTPIETTAKPAAEVVPLLNGQSVDRFFARMTGVNSGSDVHAAKQHESQVQRIDGFTQTLGTKESLTI